MLYRNVNVNIMPDLPVVRDSSFDRGKTDSSVESLKPGEKVKTAMGVKTLPKRSLYKKIGPAAL